MSSLQAVSASVVVVGDVFTPRLLTPDLLRQLFKDEQPRGMSTNMVSHLEYPLSKYSFTLEEKRFQALAGEPDATRLDRLGSIVSYFLKQNPIVKVTGVGLNFEGFVSYGEAANAPQGEQEDGEAQFLRTFAVVDALKQLVKSDIRSGTLRIAYEAKGVQCGLALRSDAVLKHNKGMGIDLNVHKNVGKRKEANSHIAQLEGWLGYLVDLGERLSGYVWG